MYSSKFIFPVLLMTALFPWASWAQCPKLVWSDEFDGNEVNPANWSYQTGGSGWGNNEWQYYRPENVTVANGILEITAREEDFGGRSYTSTRMRSINKADFTHGRFEARIKMSYGQGIWPAFWMMPTDSVHGNWPRSGEIDIMENLGSEPSTTHGTIHYGNPNHQFTGQSFQLVGGKRFADEFHVFAVEKEANEIRWYVDDIHFMTRTAEDIAPEFWPFEESYHFILNLAVGGNWPGYPDETTVFPQVLQVDYVRVYDLGSPSISGDRQVPSQAANRVYRVDRAPADSQFHWQLPNGARLVNGQGSEEVTVDWGKLSGPVQVTVTNACGARQLLMDVEVALPSRRNFSLENFEGGAVASFSFSTGQLSEADNPDPSGLNSSARVGSYKRDPGSQYDVLVYSTEAIADAGSYASGERKFFIDVYTSAPVGSEILFQLENSQTATGANFPVGRHSRYQAFTSVRNAWERIELTHLDRPHDQTGDGTIDSYVILFAPNTQSGDTWIFDNLDTYLSETLPRRQPVELNPQGERDLTSSRRQ